MKFTLPLANRLYQCDTEQALSIAIPLKFDQAQPNHFSAAIASRQPLTGGGFIGDTKQGGSCNVDAIQMVPHCNGTHTESIGHIVDQPITIGPINKQSITSCALLSVVPVSGSATSDSYIPQLDNNDRVVDLASLKAAIAEPLLQQLEAVVIRTLPNKKDKLSAQYNDTNQPVFFTTEAIEWLSQSSINHLLVDFPSLDKMYDEGHLSNHHIYWNVNADSHQLNPNSKLERTVTEMVFVDDSIEDGLFCLNLQIPAFELDAAPSQPLLFPLTEIAQRENDND